MNKLFEKEIKSWKGRTNKPTCYFYVYYFRKNQNSSITKRLNQEKESKEYLFKCLLKDGYTSEEIVNHIYNSKLEKERLNQKLKELNINHYDVKTITKFPVLNKLINYTTVYYNGTEIIF